MRLLAEHVDHVGLPIIIFVCFWFWCFGVWQAVRTEALRVGQVCPSVQTHTQN